MGVEKNRKLYGFVLFCVFGHYGFSFLFPLLSVLLISLGKLSDQRATLLMSAAFLVSGVTLPMIGRQLDQGRITSMMLLGACGILLGIGAFFYASGNFWSLLLATIGFLIGLGVLQTGSSAYLEAGVSADFRAQAASMFAAVGNLGFCLSSLLAYFYIRDHKPLLLGLDAGTSLLYLFGLYLGLMITFKAGSKIRKGKAQSLRGPSPLPWREMAGSFVLSLALCAQFTAIPFLYRAKGLDPERYLAVVTGVGAAVVAVFGLMLSRNWFLKSSRSKLVASAIGCSIGLCLVPLVKSTAGNVVVTMIWSIGETLIYPVTAVAIFSKFSAEESGRAAAIRTMIVRLCMVTVPLISFVLMQLPTWAFAAVFGVSPIVGAYMLWPAVVAAEAKAEMTKGGA